MWLPWIVVALGLAASNAEDPLPWWRTAVFYQVYPRSFKDSDGDGVGDLKGITQNADYLKELGVDAIWFNPINKSPMKDFGYDITDFTAIEPVFGTMDDFEELLAKMSAFGIKVVLDFVPNHTSDQHPWFQASVNTSHPLHEYYKDFYVWQLPKGWTTDGKPIPPSNWLSVFSGSTWQWVEDRKQFFFHHFTKEQPDLNYRCPQVVSNMTAILNFWLDKGLDGLRMDASKFLFENASFPDLLPVPGTNGSIYEDLQHTYDTDQPETFALLATWTDMVHDRVLKDGRPRAVFHEVYDPLPVTMLYYGVGNRSMQITFDFALLSGNASSGPAFFKKTIETWLSLMPQNSVPNWVIGNHDVKRVTHSYTPEITDPINMLSGVLPGVQCLYYGNEIGMEDTFIQWDETVDPRGLLVGPFRYVGESRDPVRTPMQWDNSTSAGFSKNASTWLPVNPNYYWLNVEAQRAAPASHLKVFQAVARARQDPVLQRGNLNIINHNNTTLLVIRSYNNSYYALIINWDSHIATYTSQNFFGLYGIDMDMTVVTASVSSGYFAGDTQRQRLMGVTLRPKAAILLRSGSIVPASSAASRPSLATALLSTLLTLFVLLSIH